MNYDEYRDKFNQIIQQINKDINNYTADMDEYSTSYFNIRAIISVFKECLKNSYEDLVVLQNDVAKEEEK